MRMKKLKRQRKGLNKNIIHRNFADKQMWYVLLSSDKKHLEYTLDDYNRKLLMKNEQFCIKCLEYEMLKLSYSVYIYLLFRLTHTHLNMNDF